MEAELVSQLRVSSNSSLFPSTRITELIQNAYIWATELFIWSALVKAFCTNTVAAQENYDYPATLRSDTIMRLEVDNIPYERKSFEDYLEYKYNNPNSTFKMFADFGRQFFIFPVPTATGDSNLVIHGAIQATALENSSDETIFSRHKETANMAVVKEAAAVALFASKPRESEALSKSALVTLSRLSLDEAKSRQRDQRIEHPKFNVPNFFGRGGKTMPGNFFPR